ncbi:MAG: TonB-dependent receptor [Cryomorphaceae bacterium]|nr:MAG: TonB-dependent receptor [Cryomorphaceae bacterium]
MLLFLGMGGVWSHVHGQIIKVLDSETEEPLEMVTLMSDAPLVLETTNAKGEVDISAFRGTRQIVVRRLGYRTEITNYTALNEVGGEILLKSTVRQFDEVVVSATRWSQPAQNVPSRITSITARDVALYNPQTAADLLGSSGEVFIQKSQQGGGSPMIRGFSANRLLYTVDGVRMNTAIFRSGNLQNVISLDPLAIENTEVLFGPGSIMYGSDAIGGVMAFATLAPQFSTNDKVLVKGKALSRFSSANNESTHHFDVNVGWKKWASVTSFTYSEFGDLRMGRHGPEEYLKHYTVQRIDSVDRVVQNPDPLVQSPSGYSQVNMMQKIRFKPNEHWDFQYGFHYSETSGFPRYDRLIETTGNGLPRSAVWNYGPQVWMMNNLHVSHTQPTFLYDGMSLRLAHQYFEESRIDRRFNHHRLRTQLEEVQAYSVNLDFEKKINKHQLFYGVEYVLNDVQSTASAVDIRNGNPMAVPDRYPDSQWSSYAAYLNYQYPLSEKFLMQAGARVNGFNIRSDFTRHLEFFPFDFTSSRLQNGATNGSIGAVYRPTDQWKISANLSSGFRAPNVDDIGKIFDFTAGQVIVPNTNLTAEYAYNAELNVSRIFGDVLKLDFTAFYTYLDNAMVRRAFQVNGQDSIVFNGEMSQVFAIQNAAFGTVFGFNAGAEFKLPGGFSLTSNYNFQRGEEEMENGDVSRSRHAAPAFGITRLTFRKEKLMMQLYAVYSAQVSFENLNEEERQKPFIYATDNNGNPYSPGWYTLNFKAMIRLLEKFSVTAGVENITDQRYRPYSSGLVAPGRNMFITLRADF